MELTCRINDEMSRAASINSNTQENQPDPALLEPEETFGLCFDPADGTVPEASCSMHAVNSSALRALGDAMPVRATATALVCLHGGRISSSDKSNLVRGRRHSLEF